MGLEFDYEQSLLSSPTDGLNYVFYPRTIGLIGATEREGSVGATIMKNLLSGNRGNFIIFPINPTRRSVMGVAAYKSVDHVPLAIEMAIIVLPAKIVPDCVMACGKKGVKAAVIISAGFKEVGDEGAELELKVVNIAKSYNMRIVGPNCLGIMTPNFGMNATFAARMALPGNVAFISQSGAMCTAALDWAIHQKVGFSAFVSIGSMADVQWSDMLNFLADDINTGAILIYMETIGDGRDFMSAAKAVSPKKPIIVIKAGKSEAAAEAAASHTGSLAGSHDSYLAAMKACGVLTVDSIRELFDAAVVVQKQPMPKGNRLTIITNAGGPGVLATDATSVNGGDVAALHEDTLAKLNEFLPSAWSHGNPVDILGDADANLYVKTMEVALRDPNSDGVLIILSPQSVTQPLETAKAVVEMVNKLKSSKELDKPVICSWMGGMDVHDGFRYLNENGVPCIDSPDDAAKTFTQLYSQRKYIKMANDEVIYKLEETDGIDKQKAIQILKKAQEEGQDVLSEFDSKMVLKYFGIKITENVVCESKEAAGKATELTGFPAVCKLHSDTITHKSDVGGVMLRLQDKESVEKAFDTIKENCIKHASLKDFQGITVQPMIDINAGLELLVGSLVDPQFGPLVVFGTGGCAVEIYQDTATAIPPLTPNTAMECINATKISVALHGTGTQRFPGINMKKLVKTLVNFSNMLTEVTPYVTEMEINPLLALKDDVIALDARVMIRKKGFKPEDIPKVLLRPYPSQYKYNVDLKGKKGIIRLLNVYDADALRVCLTEIEGSEWKQRFLNKTKEAVLAEVVSMCNSDYDTTIPLALFDEENGVLMGVCRGFRLRSQRDIMEFKIVTSKRYRGAGVGATLLEKMKIVAKSEGIKTMVCVVTEDNAIAVKLLAHVGFSKSTTFTNPNVNDTNYGGNLIEYTLDL